MKAEDWLNKNCKASDWSESANQANDFIHTSDVIKYMEQYHESLVTLGLPSVSGSEYLYDTVGKKEVPMWYKDTEGRPLIDLDPYGLDMGGKRTISYADKKRYEIRYH